MSRTKTKKPTNGIELPAVNEGNDQVSTPNSTYLLTNPNADLDKLKLHRDFLKTLESEENSRLTLIENKTTQLVAQTGVIFALMSLFIPLIIDRIDIYYLKLLIFIPLVLAFIFYLLTIHRAAKNFNLRNFVYSRSMATNVIKHKDNSAQDFLVEEINDLLYGIKKNTETNDVKASNLIHSYNALKIAHIFFRHPRNSPLCFASSFYPKKRADNN